MRPKSNYKEITKYIDYCASAAQVYGEYSRNENQISRKVWNQIRSMRTKAPNEMTDKANKVGEAATKKNNA